MIKTVFFDWNATLFADTQACLDADNEILTRFGKGRISRDFYQREFTMPAKNFYIKAGLDPEFIKKNIDKISRIFHMVYEERAKKCRTRKGARALLRWLNKKRIECVIVSNHTIHGIHFQLRRLKLKDYVTEVMANKSDATATVKLTKQVHIENYILRHLLKKNETLIVGDAPEEIEIGHTLGIKTIAITGGYYSTARLKKAKPDFLAPNLNEVKNIIKYYKSNLDNESN